VKWLFDTNVVSESIQPRPNPKVMRWIASETPESVAISIVTLAELRDGASNAHSEKRRNEVTTWLDTEVTRFFRNRMLPVTTEILISWIGLARRLRSQGTPREAADLLIASTAGVHKLILVTRNVRDFANTGVVVYDPWTDETHPPDPS
jgi:predicted nucleic acid-binding protein